MAMPVPAAAYCLGSDDALAERMMREASRNPVSAIRKIDQAIAATPAEQRDRMVRLQIVRNHARQMALHLDGDFLSFAEMETKRLSDDQPLWVMLRLWAIDAQDGRQRDAIKSIMPQIQALPDTSPAGMCARSLAALFLLNSDYPEDGFPLAADAYRNSAAGNRPGEHAIAASILAQIVRYQGDYRYAIALNTEALRHFERQGLNDLIVNELYIRGWVFWRQGQHELALADFERSRALAISIGNPLARDLADTGLCVATLKTGPRSEAIRLCERAYRGMIGVGSAYESRIAAIYAEILVDEGQPGEALAMLDRLITHDDGSLGSFYLPDVHATRGKAYAALGDNARAFADMTRANELMQQREDQAAIKSMAVTRARFRAEELQNSLTVQEVHHRQDIRLFAFAGAMGAIIIALLGALAFLLYRQRRLYREQATVDQLTGLPNRRHAEERATAIIAHAATRGRQACVAILDLDHFKLCNDSHGHDAGDDALRTFAGVVRQTMRPGDFFGRWGGEEFLMVIPQGGVAEMRVLLYRVAAEAETAPIALAPDFVLRFSGGAVEVPQGGASLAEVIAEADRLLYAAKASGRGRVHYGPNP
ncbi:diguanylate cyclase [Altererythrobacter xixiisoli]|uniref:diguanylate cyclase n=1 Tax=Croceibacterium xixiisoli TaxID=1476466 RepID=A0A6I4TTP2_9SPHN|nr:tetratricopeptide repeat-containing diguanylate cyclase [Croceibacterium xixiisoli]MXO98600.1 diguanylate cyclase [Croceibacterium xixiisoli]